jgi:AraC family transcriptional regulator of adaptative response/methylated-DNA-[protein]-cysteine methyltransferase
LDSRNLAEAAEAVGLSGPSRLHDLFVNIEGMTPHQYKKKGGDVLIFYGFFDSPFGRSLIAVTENGKVCFLAFEDTAVPDGVSPALQALRETWPLSHLHCEPERVRPVVERVFPTKEDSGAGIEVLLKGTDFQIKVWEALLKIPAGAVTDYHTIAELIGRPSSVRAAASAIARNPVSYLIPCHRVIRKEGKINQYRWGSTQKAALIGWEAARSGTELPAGSD